LDAVKVLGGTRRYDRCGEGRISGEKGPKEARCLPDGYGRRLPPCPWRSGRVSLAGSSVGDEL